MNNLTDLHRAVKNALASKRLGEPVFVRYLVQTLDQAETIVPRLAAVAAVVRDWLGQPLDRVYAIGTLGSGQVSLTLQFRNGATALVSLVRDRPVGSGVDLMVLGNHGAMYHDAGSDAPGNEAAAAPAGPHDPEIQALIERALRSGKPESAVTGAKP